MRVIHLISLLLLLGIQIPNSEAFVTRPTSQHITAQDHDVFSISAVASSNEEVSKIQQWSVDELEEQALKSRVVISFTTLGPGFRAVARAKHNETLIMGYVEGFLRPSGVILHLDKMEVFKKMVKRVRNEDPAMDFGGVSFAIGLLLGYRCLLHGVENGCSSAEFLAIDDEEFQHKRLVKYYKQVGFKVVKYVGEGLQDVPDRLVWGGCGTLMREEIQNLLDTFSDKLSLMKKRTQE